MKQCSSKIIINPVLGQENYPFSIIKAGIDEIRTNKSKKAMKKNKNETQNLVQLKHNSFVVIINQK